jgi:alanyl-tRNA synthetase
MSRKTTAVKTSEQIREEFLDFFREKEHEIVQSASLVPQGDSTLLFTNAGMNQFKDVFLGTGTRPYDRAADTQKCLRVSGKHNDLEEVGHDTYHHTFFEMLGNWSFGDYFKQEAIRWAWELLTQTWGLDPDRLYATVHEGDDALGLDPDDEAAAFWRSETTIQQDHILYEPSKENFWMMGDTGPCGPCSEIHIDLRPNNERAKTPGVQLVNKDHPEVMEIWNLVFIQYDAQSDGNLKPLDDQHVDTGMGFERIVAVLQGRSSTYDTDLFAPLLQTTADLSPHPEVRGYDDIAIDDNSEWERARVALRVVADHIRAIAFAIADGVTPGNVGRGYVIRRILRRAVRYGYQTLGFREPFLYKLVEPLRQKMGNSFDELNRRQDYLEQAIRAEEESFLETLGTGIAFFERIVPHVVSLAEKNGEATDELLGDLQQDAKAMDLLEKAFVDTDERSDILRGFARTAREGNVPGEVAFLLHDTYGFPIDLTRLMAREEGLDVDMDGYERLMQRQKNRARKASQFGLDERAEGTWRTISEGEESSFVGYDETSVEDATIRAVRLLEQGETTTCQLTLDRTPFYAESGGQVGDIGTLTVGDETVRVLDTQRENGRIVHVVSRLPADLDAPVTATVDAERRHRVKKHHTATHLLHAVLRDTLGDHVQQKGSLVAPDRLRFDFSHFERVSEDELRAIEVKINEVIQRNITKQEECDVAYDEAIERGAMALFGEKYGDTVRVITFDPDFSMELCGGTHVDATGEIGLFRFLSESSVAAGVRRVEAVAGDAALQHVEEELDQLRQARQQFRSAEQPLDEQIASLLEERDQLQDEVEALRRNQMASQLDQFINAAREIDGVRVVTGRIEGGADMDDLQALGQQLRDRLGHEAVGVLGSQAPGDDEKVYVVATVGDVLIRERGLQAGALVGELGKRLGGGGGGRPSLASAGGRKPDALDDVLNDVPDIVRSHMN